MIEFLQIDNAFDVDLCYVLRGDMIHARFYIHYKSGGNWGYHREFPASCLEINLLNQAVFEDEAFTAAKNYIDRKDKTITDGQIVRVLEHAPTLKNCFGVVASYNGDDNYLVCFQQNVVVTIGIHFLEAVDPVHCAKGTWDTNGRYDPSFLRLLR